MTAVITTPRALERYLRRATLGLPPERREEVWNELEEHVLCRAERLEFQGLTPDAALAQALRELGPPLRVSAGMNGVHNMPKMIAFGTVVLLAVSAGLYTLAGGFSHETIAELPALSQRPQEPSCTRKVVPESPLVTIVSRTNGETCFTFSNEGTFVALQDVEQAYAEAGLKTQSDPQGNLRVTFPNGEWRALSPQFKVDGKGYTSANMLIVSTVRQSLTPELKLAGYDNPLLSLGHLKLRLGTQKQPVAGSNFYLSLLGTLIGFLTSENLEQGWAASWYGVNHLGPRAATRPFTTVQTSLKAGEVVMLVTRARHSETSYFADIAPVNTDGKVRLFTEGQTLTFTEDLEKLTDLSGQNLAVLVRISGVDLRDLKSGIFLPN